MADDFCKEFAKVQKKHKVEELTILVQRVHQAANVGAPGLVARSTIRPILHPRARPTVCILIHCCLSSCIWAILDHRWIVPDDPIGRPYMGGLMVSIYPQDLVDIDKTAEKIWWILTNPGNKFGGGRCKTYIRNQIYRRWKTP